MEKKIRTLIVDDEALAREGIQLLVGRDPQVEVVGECANGRETLAAVPALSPDLLFLDVQMPEMNGFETIARLDRQLGAERLPAIIFVTAYDQFALQAFEAQALDYLLKPFSDERFFKALARAKTQIEQKRSNEQNRALQDLLQTYQKARAEEPSAPHLDRLMVKSGGRISFIAADEIDWIEAADYYVLLHVGGRSHLLRETMAELEAKLDPQKFLRIHRSTVVNVGRVRALQTQGSGDYLVILRDDTRLKLSRRRRETLQIMLERLS